MNPGVAAERTTVFPHPAASSAAASATSGAVASPEMTSTSLMAGTGLKKCSPTSRPGCASPAAIAVGVNEEELDASMQSGPTTPSSSANSAFFAPRSSTIASATTPHSLSPAISTAVRSSAAGSASSRPFSTCALTRSRIFAIARSAAPGTASARRTRRPATAATCAIPAPIVPAPTTPIGSVTGPAFGPVARADGT